MRTFRDAGISGDFVHTRLQDAKNQIRLVHVKPSDTSDDKIECTISTHNLSDAIPFAAISYTWGDMASMRDIWLENKRVSIGENSRLVLWQARLHRCPFPLWIDVLSINQDDDEEKSSQVSIMASIYAAANFTCVGLGRSKDDSEFLAAEIRENAYYIEHSRARSKHPPPEPTTCTACGSLPTPRTYRCKQCVHSAAYCVACKRTHRVQAGHDIFLDVRTDSNLRDVCVQCEQRLSMIWYQPKDSSEGHLTKMCEACAEIQRCWTSDSSWDCEHVRMNEWEHMTKPGGLSRYLQSELKPSRERFWDGPLKYHLEITDALRLLSIRPYFARLWIVQEILRSRSVVMVCGKDLFHLWELEAFADAISITPGEDGYRQRLHDLHWVQPSFYFESIALHRMGTSDPIWDVVHTFSSHYCSDPRDRVFGLLALADSESREAFTTDYTKTPTMVLLQLLEHHAKTAGRHDYKGNFGRAHGIIGAFGLGPENQDISAMRDRRRTAAHDDGLIRNITATRNQKRLAIRENDSCHSCGLPRGPIPHTTFNHVVFDARLRCRVWKNDANEFVAPLRRRDGSGTSHDFSTREEVEAEGIRLRTLDGSVVGLVDKQTQHGDTILLFEGGHFDNAIFRSGLIVRKRMCYRGGTFVATIVGQCIFNSDFVPCEACSHYLCSRPTHFSDEERWRVHMSPEDLLVFIAQDLKLVHRQPKKFEVPMVDLWVQLDQSRQRLSTRVTSEEFSSYAIVTPSPSS